LNLLILPAHRRYRSSSRQCWPMKLQNARNVIRSAGTPE
jgi:hypothetical protein